MNPETLLITLRLGTRGSTLARMQSQMVADALENSHPNLSIELIICKTSGDRITDRPLYEEGGKGLFTKELEEALLANQIDFAVHSLKDVPVTMPLVEQSDLIIAAVPVREDAADVMVAAGTKDILQLSPGAKVGTGSLRRKCQLLAIRPDLQVESIRGNIDTRIRKLRDGQYDAIILAMAGVKRSGMFNSSEMVPIPMSQMLPAAAQGALAIQCRRSDPHTRQILAALDDVVTHRCVDLERSVVAALNGDCRSPIAALATMDGDQVHLRVAVGARDGELPVIRAEAIAPMSDMDQALRQVIRSLEQQHVHQLLAG